MKKFYSLCLFLISIGVSASNITSDFPEAYAGLDPQSYHNLDLSSNKSNELSFTLAGKQINLSLPATEKGLTASSSISFVQNIEGGTINATKGEDSLFGQMHLNNKHYILTTNHAGIWAVELPESGIQYNTCGVEHANQHSPNELIVTKDNQEKAAGTIIDVLVIYDQAFRDRYPGSLLQTRVDQYFHVSNQTYANSEIDLAIRLVGLEQVGYNFNDGNRGLRDQIQQSLSIGIGSQGLENVPQLREDTGADLVIFLRNHNIETRGNCGIAFFPVSFPGTNGLLDSSYGVNVMADGMSSWSVCTDQLMVHEIGHNLSAGHHNWDPTEFGISAEARGFAKLGQYGTVMGSFGTGNPNRFFELDYFSNPNVQCGGAPCGIPGTANNAQVINQFKEAVANYQASISTAPVPDDFELLLTDIDGDGVFDDVDQFPFDANDTTDTDGDGVGDNKDAFPTDFNEQLDSDGDGIGDLADLDDDNDGTLDVDDAFPLNAAESFDADFDGVGDNADAFPFELTESRDPDGDGIGNYSDPDDDNDGVMEVSDSSEDLLVISVGNNRILRFDAQTGLAKGIEVLPEDGLLTFQSDLTVDQTTQTLYYTSASSVRTHNLLNRDQNSQLLLPAYADNNQPQLGTGFPSALEVLRVGNSAYLITAKMDLGALSSYFLQNLTMPLEAIHALLPGYDEMEENIIDIEFHDDFTYYQGQQNSVYRSTLSGSGSIVLGNGNYTWLNDPYAMVAFDDQLLHSDQGRNKIVITNAVDGTYGGIFADIAELGYSNPTGLDVTKDGRLLVAVSDQNTLLQFDVTTGEFLGELVSGFGLDQPHKILLVPQLQDRFHEDENKVLRPNAGNWYNPATSGRGFNIGIFDNRLQVLWFTYDNDGNPIWYTAADFLNDHTFSADLLKTKQLPDESISIETIGQITLEFANERTAMMSWQIGQDSGQEPIQWLQFSVEPDVAGYTGMWTRPDSPGWGTAVINNGDKTIAIPFIYDDNGDPRWVISDVAEGLQPFNFNMNTVFSDTLCPTCSGESNVVIESSGSMQFELSNTPYWSSDLTWPTPLSGGWDLNQTSLVRISSEPTRPR